MTIKCSVALTLQTLACTNTFTLQINSFISGCDPCLPNSWLWPCFYDPHYTWNKPVSSGLCSGQSADYLPAFCPGVSKGSRWPSCVGSLSTMRAFSSLSAYSLGWGPLQNRLIQNPERFSVQSSREGQTVITYCYIVLHFIALQMFPFVNSAAPLENCLQMG